MRSKNGSIFIMGSERSGSNLLRSLLSNHRNLHGPISAHLLVTFWDILPKYGSLKLKENLEYLFNDMLKISNHPYHNWDLNLDFEHVYDCYEPASFLALYDAFTQESALKARKKRFVSKDINLSNFIFPLLSYYDSPKIIYLYRDPRDYVASWMKKPLHLCTPFDAVTNWVKEQEIYENLINFHGLDVCRVRYEDLIANTPEEIEKILFFVGEELDVSCTELNPNEGKKVAWNPYWKNLAKPVIHDNDKKYKQMKNEDVLLIESIARLQMDIKGYKLDTNGDWQQPIGFNLKNKIQKRLVKFNKREHITKDMERLQSKMNLMNTFPSKKQYKL